MSHSHSSGSDLLLFPVLPQRLTSRLCPSHGDEHPPDPQTAARFGRVATQSLVTVYEPNVIVEFSSTEVTLVHPPSRRRMLCSVKNSGEDTASSPVSFEVDEKTKHRKAGFTGAHAAERSKCSPCKDLSLYRRIFYVTFISHSERRETCRNALTRTEIEQRHKKRTRATSHQ